VISGSVVENAATTAAHKAFTSPAARSAAQEAMPSAMKSIGASWNAKREEQNPGPSSNEEQSPSAFGVGRVAAAAAALSSSRFSSATPPVPPGGAPPRQPPRRLASSAEASDDSPPPPGPPPRPGSTANKFVTTKSFGDVDTSSGKNMFTSLRNSTANKSTVQPPPQIQSTFQQKKNAFTPPPMRRVSSGGSSPSAPPPPPARPRVQEEEPEGEWAEVLYDYSSEDPEDLDIRANQRVLIVEKPSEDWWTGELNGKRGLVPAAYVKLV